jgi:hypothetical protein
VVKAIANPLSSPEPFQGFCNVTVPAAALTPVTSNIWPATRLPVAASPLVPMITSWPLARALWSALSIEDVDDDASFAVVL